MIKINGSPLPKYPSTFEVTIADFDDGRTTGRTMDGVLHRDRIAVKRKLNMSFNTLTNSEISTLLQMVSSTKFDVEYPDPMTGDYQTKTFYVGDRNSPLAIFKNNEPIWTNTKFNFIEL